MLVHFLNPSLFVHIVKGMVHQSFSIRSQELLSLALQYGSSRKIDLYSDYTGKPTGIKIKNK